MSLGLVLVVIGLLLANAFFVGAEFAIISARRSSIEPRAQEGSRAAQTVLWAMENVSLMLATAQLGITVCSVSLGVVAEPAIAHAIEKALHGAISPHAAHGIGVAIALVIIVGLHVIFGEMVPKNAAVSSPDKAALLFGPPLVWIARGAKPLIAVLNAGANGLLRLAGIEPRDEVTSAFTAAEVQSIVARSSEEGTFSDDEGLLQGAIEFSDHTAADVMVPVDQVVCVRQGVSAEELENLAVETGFSRFPVRDDNGAMVGYLHVKDAIQVRPSEREDPLANWRIRDIAEVAADAEVEAVLASMRRSGAHISLVKAHGAVAGAVFLEDIIEELVGEVRDMVARVEGDSTST